MRAHLLTVLVIDNEDNGVDEAINNLEQSTDYHVFESKTADIGEWTDSHPLNMRSLTATTLSEYFK